MKLPKLWLRDVVLVQFTDNSYHGPLVLPVGIKHYERIGTATIVAIGSKFRYKDDIKIGDRVYVDTYLGNRRSFDGKEFVTFDGEDILGVVL